MSYINILLYLKKILSWREPISSTINIHKIDQNLVNRFVDYGLKGAIFFLSSLFWCQV